MEQLNLRDRFLSDMRSGDDAAIVAATYELLALGEYGSPAGIYLLEGGRAAFRLGRIADSAVLLFQGLKVVEPYTETWMMLLVCRAVACAHGGLYLDAIESGTQYLENVSTFPGVAEWLPRAHHALGLAHDRRGQYAKAVPHHHAAVNCYGEDSPARAIAAADLAYSLARSGSHDEAERVLSQIPGQEHERARFVVDSTMTLVRYLQGRYSEAVVCGASAESLAAGKDEKWALPLAELRLWLARSLWAIGDGYRAALTGLRCAVMARKLAQADLCDHATDLLAEIRAKGGI